MSRVPNPVLVILPMLDRIRALVWTRAALRDAGGRP
jgi:hypothetical protein